MIGPCNAPIDAEQVLDVVPKLVPDDVRLGESPQPDLAGEQVKEAQVQIDRTVSGAVERTYVFLKPAARVYVRREER